jgi:stage V sporulation protein S
VVRVSTFGSPVNEYAPQYTKNTVRKDPYRGGVFYQYPEYRLNLTPKSCTICIDKPLLTTPKGGSFMEMIKVSANSRTSAVAGAIAGVIREHKHADVQAIGAGAVNQAVKALVLATGYLKNDGIDIVCVPEFVDVEIEDKIRTAIKIVVEPR